MSAPVISLRQYFAAHAPAEIPDWFRHVERLKAFPLMPSVSELDEAHRVEAASWAQDPCFDLPEEISWWGEKVIEHRAAKADWYEVDKVARYVQWRWAYADLMLEAS